MAEKKTKPTDARRRGLHRLESQRPAAIRLPRADGPARDGHSATSKNVGPSIVGYGSYRYTYESGRTGEAPLAGFAIRGRELVVDLNAEGDRQKSLLSRLGRHKMGKVCLYFKQLADLAKSVLRQLVTNSIADAKRRYG